MKIKTKISNLLPALDSLARVASKPNSGVYSKVLFQLMQDELVLVASNGHVQVSVPVKDCAIEGGRSYAVDFYKLHSIIKTLPEEKPATLNFKDDGKLSLSCGKSRSSIGYIDGADYPTMLVYEAKDYIKGTEEIGDAIHAVSFASARKHTRKNANGVTLFSSNGKLSVAATDTVQMAMINLDIDFTGEAIIPIWSIGVVRQFMSSDFLFYVESGSLYIENNGSVCVVNLIDMPRLPFERLIPSEDLRANSLTFDKGWMLDVLNRISIVADNPQTTRCVVELPSGTSDATIVGYEVNGINKSTDSITINNDGDGTTVAFNPKLAMGMLSAVNPENKSDDNIISCGIYNTSGSPLAFRGGNFIGILGQVRV